MRRRLQEKRDEIAAARRARRTKNLSESRRRDRERAATPRARDLNRAAVARYQAANPEKVKARHLVRVAVQRGDIVKPDVCQAEGCSCAGPLHGHHSNYAEPKIVDWLCTDHHEFVHHNGRVRLKQRNGRRIFAYAPDDLRPPEISNAV